MFFTNLRLKTQGIREISTAELVDYYMLLMAAAVFHRENHGKSQAANLRHDVQSTLKVLPSWPGKTRLETIKSNLCIFDSDANEPQSMTEKVKSLVQLFNKNAADIVRIPGVSSASQVLSETFRDEFGCSVLFNHLSYIRLGYMPKLSVSEMCEENERIRSASNKKIRNKPIKGMFTGTRGTNESGESSQNDSKNTNHLSADETVEILRVMSEKGIPFVSRVHERMQGNFPILTRDTRKPLQKRLFIYRVKDESIFLHVIYDQWNAPPILYLSNFHTKTFSYVLKAPPLIRIYHNCFVGQTDPTLANISRHFRPRKAEKWALYCIEAVVSYTINNARVAFALKNPTRVPCLDEYTIKHFFMDILKEHFPPIKSISRHELNIQPAHIERLREKCSGKHATYYNKRCWKKGCKGRGVDICRNRGCDRAVGSIYNNNNNNNNRCVPCITASSASIVP